MRKSLDFIGVFSLFLLPLFARFLPAPQVIFDLLFGVKPAPERAHPRTPAHMHTLTRSHAPARAYYLYIYYIFITFPRVCARPPRSPAPLRTRFYLFPFLYDLFSSLSPLFMIYFPFLSSLYDLFIKLYIYIPFFMIYL